MQKLETFRRNQKSIQEQQLLKLQEAHASQPLTGFEYEGLAEKLLYFVEKKFPFHSPAVDRLHEAIQDSQHPEYIKFVFLSQAKDYETFVGREEKPKLFLVIHPLQKEGRYVSLATNYSGGDTGIHYGYYPVPILDCIRGKDKFGLNLLSVHQEGFGGEITKKLTRIKGVYDIGGMTALNPVVDGKAIFPKKPRTGCDGTSDDMMSISIPLVDISPMHFNQESPSSIENANWEQGWQVYGLTDLTARQMPHIRRMDLEQIPLSAREISDRLKACKTDLEKDTEQLQLTRAPQQGSLLVYEDPYGIMRSIYQGMYFSRNDIEERCRPIEMRIVSTRNMIARLEKSVNDPSLPVSLADLGIHVIAPSPDIG